MCEHKRAHYINSPEINKLTAPENKLYRPKIKWFIAMGNTIALIVFPIAISIIIKKHIKNKNIFSLYWKIQFIALLAFAKKIIIWVIRVYQAYAPSDLRLRCRYTPSCSEYAILALMKYGVVKGSYMTIKRLQRCKEPGGIDFP